MRFNRKSVFLFLILFGTLWLAFPGEQSFSGAQGLRVAPDFILPDLSQKKVRLTDFKGKVVVLNFFATWCPPCRAEIPELNKLYRLNKEKGLVVLGVSLDMDLPPQSLTTFVKDKKITYPVLMGTTDLAEKYQVNGVPTTILINRAGKPHTRYDGLVPASRLEKDLNNLL
ncbi:MAG: TlpA family protein disulfide reductase [Desulfobacteraceae bacterium]|nr:MAG: TlpA family protein disulfide reductase [Desulfobacteraceae bacterium]